MDVKWKESLTEWEIKNLRRYLDDISDDQISY